VLLAAAPASAGQPKVLLVVAHPDDEYTFAATVYRVAKELGGAVDEVIITDGAGDSTIQRCPNRSTAFR
jgi:LmbE family N-acetylglucosaminyl deacetylase